MIEVRGLTKKYAGKAAVQDAGFTVRPGEIVGFLGPNGSGKSTTLKILAGFLPPTSGEARICGHDCLDDSLEARRRVGYLPENNPLYLDLPVRVYLDYMAALRDVPAKTRRLKVEAALEKCWLQTQADTLIGKLSKGYRQRVGLAQALVHEPPVLLLDEPTDGLDPKQIVQMRGLIRELGSNHTVLLASHILAEVQLTCDRVVVISNGKVVAEASITDLKQSGEKGRVALRLRVQGRGCDVVELVRAVSGVVEVSTSGERDGAVEIACSLEAGAGSQVRAELGRRLYAAGYSVLEMAEEETALERVFLELVLGGDAESVTEEG